MYDYLRVLIRCVAPRSQVPDMEMTACTRCDSPFTLFLRRHHCRACGQIFCQACSDQRLLLEKEYKLMTPQRVCLWCSARLGPMQAALAGTVANRNRTNEIDTQSYSRYMNLPYSKTLGSELRKAAYAVSNMFHPSVIKDNDLTLPLLQQAQGLAFLTVIKGIIFGVVMDGARGAVVWSCCCPCLWCRRVYVCAAGGHRASHL